MDAVSPAADAALEDAAVQGGVRLIIERRAERAAKSTKQWDRKKLLNLVKEKVQ